MWQDFQVCWDPKVGKNSKWETNLHLCNTLLMKRKIFCVKRNEAHVKILCLNRKVACNVRAVDLTTAKR